MRDSRGSYVLIVPGQRDGELLERDAEPAAIADVVRGASAGIGGALVLEGEAGVGKTRLLDAVEGIAGDEPVLLLRASGGELERSFPFGIAVQLLAPAVAGLNAARRASVLSGAASLAAPLVDRGAAAQLPSSIGSPEALFACMHGLYWLCAGLAAQTPLVVIVDDAHWADAPSLQWLLFLARRLEDMPLTLVMAARPATAGDPAEPLTLLRDDPHMSVLHPQPFSEDATAAVVRGKLGEDAEQGFCAACHEATGGNPFFLGELLETARTQLARAHADPGTALRRAGRRREAQQELRTALDLADRCGGRVIAERARSELLVTGARPAVRV